MLLRLARTLTPSASGGLLLSFWHGLVCWDSILTSPSQWLDRIISLERLWTHPVFHTGQMLGNCSLGTITGNRCEELMLVGADLCICKSVMSEKKALCGHGCTGHGGSYGLVIHVLIQYVCMIGLINYHTPQCVGRFISY